MKLPVVESASPWYANGLSFACTQCGNCCTGAPGYVWVSETEIDRFCAHLKMDREKFIRTYCRSIGGKISLKERKSLKGEYDCVFLKEIEIDGESRRPGAPRRVQRVCTVYEVRPLQCRTWPFWDGLLASREAWEHAAQGCPGMNKGRKYTIDQIHALRDAEDWPEKTR